ncbi:MAG: glutamine synthetase type III [Bacillota bacterium]|uniref:Glutamine synthetase III n=1 Tax=Candidatus Gallimonas intestinavium TaxID=2838603 RepID=A0A9D2JYU8_9FIRM|nr:MAG: glutamine synthetase type III [Bacillota bacterium]HIZ72336.1 glutamine synthetase III [Candidatus Gallimonas intestinavium]
MNVTELFGSNVFNDEVMKNLLPKEVYTSLRRTIDTGAPLDSSIASAVANAMKDWAVSKGATHYTHWFQPLTNLTAEKHDSFIEPSGDRVIMQLTGKSLIVGEPDASSFPSGGTRATFSARGYTAWDPTSPAFVKEGTLYIPTVFVSYTGETLDKKAPLLKSMTAIDAQAKRLLRLFGIECKKVSTTVGPEQEYFLIDEKVYEARKDLILTGRTLFGARPPRGQEMEDHYFGSLKPRISAYMRDLDETLWKYGIFAKTKHNEVAPAQHELAPVFTTTNVAVDDNQLTMEIMKKVAARHGLVCLLHEKPFEYINGSGKHNNWSVSTDTGLNLLDPGETPENNRLFMLVLACVIAAVDRYQGILRACVASAGNDHRLGADEAPPAIVSVYLGDQLGAIVDSIVLGREYVPKKAIPGSIGVPESPIFPIDTTDRNRTSPFAFTGNKFEFRMLGSMASVADPNIVLNTIAAELFSEAVEALSNAKDFDAECKKFTEKLLKRHYRIIFNYNGYGPDWEPEAERRGLLNNKTTADAVPELLKQENIDVFVHQGVYTEKEVIARANIQLENYIKSIRIEALTMIEMARQDIYPAVNGYLAELCGSIASKRAVSEKMPVSEDVKLAEKLATMNDAMMAAVAKLERDLSEMPEGEQPASQKMAHVVLPDMEQVRVLADGMEKLCSSDYWPYPTYTDILYSVK